MEEKEFEKFIQRLDKMPSFQIALSFIDKIPFVWLRVEYYKTSFYLVCHGSFNVEPGYQSTFKTSPSEKDRLSIKETLLILKLIRKTENGKQ